MHRLRTLSCVAVVAVIAIVACGALAAPPAAERMSLKGKAKVARATRPQSIDNSKTIDINNISMFVTNTGSFAWDKGTGNAGLEFPKATGKTAVFAAGLWIGGQVGGVTRLAVSEYSDEYQPGAIVSGAPDDPTKAEYKVYKLNRVYTDTATRDADLADYNLGAVPHGAPVVTVQTDGSLDILGDQMTWAVYNDLNPASHQNRAGRTAPLGLEVQQTTFAFNRQGALGNTIFMRYLILNKGPNNITNMFVSQWSDPDLGDAADDLVGCDTTLSLGYVYNATNADAIYGSQVPAVGYDFFKGPAVGGTPLPMTSFNKYINGTDPNTFDKSYNYMKGLNADGTPLVNPTTGLVTKFSVSGDPVLGGGWLDTNPADRRLQLSSGPFTMAIGETQEVVAAIVVGQSTNRLASIALMKFYDSFAQAAFDANFDLPNPPNSPHVVATPLTGAVRLSWDSFSENYNEPPYAFEGYVVYQGASIAGPFKRVATYDVVDGITTVLDPDFDPEQGLILQRGSAFGQNSGLRYTITLEDDAIRGGPLHDGTTYYYTVNAYAVGLGQLPQVLESANNVVAVVPQSPPAGVDLSTGQASAVVQAQISTVPPPTTDQVSVVVVDPAVTIDATWQVGFKPACGTAPSRPEGGAPCTERVWYLVRTVGATVDTVVNNWPDFSGGPGSPVVNGIQARVLSYPPGTLGNVAYVDTAGGSATALEGVDRGMRWFGGGAGYAKDDLGGTIATDGPAPNVEIRFTGGTPGQKAYRYVRTLNSAGDRVYFYGDSADALGGYVDVPFTVWDLDAGVQKNAAFLENAGPPPAANYNGQWDPSASGDGGREAIWVLASNYSGNTPDPFYTDPDNDDLLAGTLDLRYEFWSKKVSASSVIDAGDKVEFITSIPASPNDYFTFSTTAANRMNVSLARSELDRVLVVPNPYYAHSSYELNQFLRVVKFTHLPAECTIRIFNLAGDQIRTLRKSDATSQLSWDLETDRGLPVGSGIYVFHVEAPGIGSKVGKMVIFMEKERLNNF